MWERSTHANKRDATLNETCHMITGCLKPTHTNSMPVFGGIAPVRHQEDSGKLYGTDPVNYGRKALMVPRLKSRRSFINYTESTNATGKAVRIELWRERFESLDYSVYLNVSASKHLPADACRRWTTWQVVKQLRTQVARS